MTANNTLINILSNMEDNTFFEVQRGDIVVCTVFYEDGIYTVTDTHYEQLFTSSNVAEVSMYIENMEVN